MKEGLERARKQLEIRAEKARAKLKALEAAYAAKGAEWNPPTPF
jgi:hypothetical protein